MIRGTRPVWLGAAALLAIAIGASTPSTHGAFSAGVGSPASVSLTPFFSCAAVVSSEQQRGSLVFAYALDDGPGATTAADSSGNGVAATYAGTVATTAPGPGGCRRDGGSAWAPDGTTSGLTTGSVMLRSTFTFELRFRTAQSTAALASVRIDQYGQTYSIALVSGVPALVGPGGQQILSGGPTLSDDGWHHLALVVEDSGIRLYADGQDVAFTGLNLPDGLNAVWRLAYDDDGNSDGLPRLQGALRFAELTNRALSAADVRAHDAAGRTPVLAGATPSASAPTPSAPPPSPSPSASAPPGPTPSPDPTPSTSADQTPSPDPTPSASADPAPSSTSASADDPSASPSAVATPGG